MRTLTLILLTVFTANLAYSQDLQVLSLQDCINYGIKNNPDIQKLQYDLLNAEESENQVLGLYEPGVNLSINRMLYQSFIPGAYSEQDNYNLGVNKLFIQSGGYLGLDINNKREPSIFTQFGVPDTPYQSSVTLSYSQPLWKNFLGKNNRKSLKMIQLQKSIAEYSLELQKNILKNSITKAYLDLSYAKRNLAIQEDSLKRAKDFHQSNLKKFRDGLLEEVDIIASEASITIREANLLLAKDSIENAKDNLINIIFLPRDKAYSFNLELSTGLSHNNVIEKDVISIALDNRSELKISKTSTEIISADRTIKDNEKLPDLSLTTQCGLSGAGDSWNSDFNEITDMDNKTWYVGIDMKFSPFMKSSKSAYMKSKYSYDKASVEHDALKSNIVNQCRSIVRYLNTMAKYIEASGKALKLQEKKLYLEGIKFNQGRSNSQFILNYQDDLSRAETDYLKALTDYHKALADLKLVRGEF
ncbi:MAG: TolC family protein [Endomicrobiales bacterium]|nr:TolC family protein [Endomicrobiales bacterium]